MTSLVTTLDDEVPARYREWVETQSRAGCTSNPRDASATCTCPDMMSAGFAEFHRYFILECDRDG